MGILTSHINFSLAHSYDDIIYNNDTIIINKENTKLFFNHIYMFWRMLAQAMCMTGSDLCSSSKSWDHQLSTTCVIYQEFYEQVLS